MLITVQVVHLSVLYVVVFQMLGNLVVETVYPAAGLYHERDWLTSRNENRWRSLCDAWEISQTFRALMGEKVFMERFEGERFRETSEGEEFRELCEWEEFMEPCEWEDIMGEREWEEFREPSEGEEFRKLCEGQVFREARAWPVFAGSRPEGLCVEDGWGHGHVDIDMMLLFGCDLGVYVVAPGQQPPRRATLLYTPQQCPPAYTRLQVLHKDRLLRAIAECNTHRDNLSVSDPNVQKCVVSDEGGRLWLHSQHTLEVIQGKSAEAISGPAGQSADGLIDNVSSLVCSGPHPAMASYKERTRKHWPSPALLKDLMKQPMILVMVGPKDAQDSYLMFRVSWSALELILIASLGLWLKQGYVCFKYTVKSLLKSLRPKDSAREGRSQVGSYHLKTVFLRHLEEHPPQQEGSPFQLMLDLCQDLQHYLLMGCLPHYFLPECDLLRTVGEEERQYALQAVGQVIADPLVVILNSTSEPEEIYGPDHSPDDLIHCFRDLSSLPSCPERFERLQRRLRHLDNHREGLHRRELERAEGEVSGRPGLVRLADYL